MVTPGWSAPFLPTWRSAGHSEFSAPSWSLSALLTGCLSPGKIIGSLHTFLASCLAIQRVPSHSVSNQITGAFLTIPYTLLFGSLLSSWRELCHVSPSPAVRRIPVPSALYWLLGTLPIDQRHCSHLAPLYDRAPHSVPAQTVPPPLTYPHPFPDYWVRH